MTRWFLVLCAAWSCGGLAWAVDEQAQAASYKAAGDDFAAKDDTEHAAGMYIKALARGHFSIEDRIKLATAISWGGRYPAAAKEFRAILKEDPTNKSARIGLAKTLIWMKDNKGALAEIDIVLKKTPDDRDALLVEASLMRQTRRFDEAISIYERILKDGDDFDAGAGLAYALLENGDLAAARARAASLKSEHSYQENELKELRAELAAPNEQQQALSAKKTGDLFAAKDDLKHAADAYIKALSLGSFSIEDRMKLGMSISWAGRYPQAVETFRGILKDDPTNLKARVALAKSLAWMGDNKSALAEVEAALHQSPDDRDALLLKANALRTSGGVKESIEIYNKLLDGGDDFDTRAGLVYALLASGDKKAARAQAASLKTQFPYQTRELKELRLELRAAPAPK